MHNRFKGWRKGPSGMTNAADLSPFLFFTIIPISSGIFSMVYIHSFLMVCAL